MNNVKYNTKYFWITVFVSTFLGNISAFLTGIHLGWLIPVVPKLTSELKLNENPLDRVARGNEMMWMRSSFFIGAIVGPMVAAFTIHKVGRKNALIVCVAAPYFVSLVTLAFAKLVFLFYIGRFVGGLGIGSFYATFPLYLGEISPVSIRGRVLCLINFFVCLGILFDLSVSPFVAISIFCFLCSLICAVFFIVFVGFPGSPYYYLSVGDVSGAEKALMRLLGVPEAEARIQIQATIDEIENEKQKGKTIMQLLRSNPVRRSLIMTMSLVALQQLSGVEVVELSVYSTFKTTSSELSENTFGIIVGGIQVVISILPPLVVDKLGRKLLLFVSGMGIIVGNAYLGLYWYAIEHGVYTIKSWIAIGSLTTFKCAFHLGYGPLPWTIMGEVFYVTIRPLAGMITATFCFIVGFSVSYVTPILADELGKGYTFWLFSVFGVVGVFFTELYMYETMNKSLRDIQDELDE